MNIIYIGAFRLPYYDAAAARVLNNARIFQLCNNVVSFISWGGKYDKKHLCDDGKYRIDSMEYIVTEELDPQGTLFKKAILLLNRGKKSIAILKKMECKPDVIILYNAHHSWTKRMIEFCNIHHIKLVNDITEWYDNHDLHFWDIFSYHINMTKTQHLIKNKIVISSYLNKYYKESNNLQLPPLCDGHEKKWNAIVQDDCIKPFNGITLIYAGNPAKKDCVHTVINAVNTLANENLHIRFLILGITKDNYIKNYRKVLMSDILHENIIFLGRVSQELIPAYYKKADFMVLLRKPSRKNMAGFPTKCAEAITAGVPVITNATSDLEQYIRNGKNGFIVPGYEYHDILSLLRDTILSLPPETICKLKIQTKGMRDVFDYRTHVKKVEYFLNNLQ